jgi:hypothetical protein
VPKTAQVTQNPKSYRREVKNGHEREQEIEVVKEFERKALVSLPEAWSGLKTYGSDVFGAGGITQGCDSLDDWWRRSGQTLNSKLQTLNFKFVTLSEQGITKEFLDSTLPRTLNPRP